MWPWIKDEPLYAAIDADQILLMHGKMHNKQAQVGWVERIPIHITSAGLLWNMPAIQAKLIKIFQHYAADQQQLHIVLMPPLSKEMLVTSLHHTNVLNHLVPDAVAHQHYCHHLLGPDQDCYLFYVGYVARALVLQLELLVLDTPVYLSSVRMRFLVQKKLYQLFKGSAYRHIEEIGAIDREQIDLLHSCRSLVECVHGAMDYEYDDLLVHALSMFIGDNQWSGLV